MKNKNLTNNEISDMILERYQDEIIDKSNQIISQLDTFVQNKIAYKLSKREDISDIKSIFYRCSCKWINKFNKYPKRDLMKFEYGSDESISNNKDLLKLNNTLLNDGKYFALLDNDNFCILDISYSDFFMNTNLYFIGDNKKKWLKKFNKFLNKYKELLKTDSNYYINRNGFSYPVSFKPFSKLVISNKERIINYIDNWLEAIPIYYSKYNIIPKLSILLYGPPGTGKSTFYKSVAEYLKIHYVTSLTEKDFSSEYRYYPSSMFAIDDIDCICKKRKDNDNKILQNLLAFLDDPPQFQYKAKDGVSYPISIVIATTNLYDELDPAIKRSGRFDLTIKLDLFDKELAEEMCSLYDLKLSNILPKFKITDTIVPAKLEALCLENINNKLIKDSTGYILIHRKKK